MIIAQTIHPDSVLLKADDDEFVLHMSNENNKFAFYVPSKNRLDACELYQKLWLILPRDCDHEILTVGAHNTERDPLQAGNGYGERTDTGRDALDSADSIYRVRSHPG